MQFKKSKTFLAALLATAMTCSALAPTAASAAGIRTKDEAYGDDTYAARFMSMYDDVVTNGVANGYMSSTSTVSGGLGIPYHSIEELCIEAPDYGHETTSEALSYLVWAAAMRDNIVNAANNGEVTVANVKDASTESVGDLAKAWLTLEATMIPDVQGAPSYNFMSKTDLSATYSSEWEQIELYPTDMASGNTAANPIHSYFVSTYGQQDGDKGLYLMHWLADVDDWYGYGAANGSQYSQTKVSGSFTLINTFQRGEQESCWETIPHACVDTHGKYGLNGTGGMKGFFNTEAQPGEQWSYTNAPDAEDRAIQAVYAANRWGVGDQSITSKWGGTKTLTELAAKMGDETRNNMYDKYYKAIGCGANIPSSQNAQWSASGGSVENGKHYLMNWYTSWGGALLSGNGDWAWQIGASHMHEFYQNPLVAYALAYDTDSDGGNGLSGNMKAQGAISDFQTSLERQIELYLWLLSSDGPIAGGCTNSYQGRYTGYSDLDVSTFYDMMYLEHPVYADPGSNHWIGNQVWAVQRLAELYYVVKGTSDANISIAQTGLTLEQALEKILDKWVAWFVDKTILGQAQDTYEYRDYYEPYDTERTTWTLPVLDSVVDDGVSFSIPSSLIWDDEPETWTGKYQDNNSLTCTIVGYGDGDLGCVSSLANTLIYYAKAKGVSGSDLDAAEESYKSSRGNATTISTDELAKQSLYLAKELLDREWNAYRDDYGLGVNDHNTNLNRLWETKLVLPNGTYKNGDGQVLQASRYTGKMANGDEVKDGVSFVDIRSNYEDVEMYQTALQYYNGNGEDVDGNGSVGVEDYYFTLHRFWHAGDIMMALGAMYELYPDVTPDSSDVEKLVVTPSDLELTIKDGVGESDTLNPSKDGCTFESSDPTVATVDENGVVTAVGEGETTIVVKDTDGNEVSVSVTVTDESVSTTADTTTTSIDTTTETETEATGATTSDSISSDGKLGDVNLDGIVNMSDSILLNKYSANVVDFVAQQRKNGNCFNDGTDNVDGNDAMSLLKFQVQLLNELPEYAEN